MSGRAAVGARSSRGALHVPLARGVLQRLACGAQNAGAELLAVVLRQEVVEVASLAEVLQICWLLLVFF